MLEFLAKLNCYKIGMDNRFIEKFKNEIKSIKSDEFPQKISLVVERSLATLENMRQSLELAKGKCSMQLLFVAREPSERKMLLSGIQEDDSDIARINNVIRGLKAFLAK